ncbi:unnamed protein product [Eruca vesicaria subsp. sativa]|uniref:Uncharacterized protein n=1 Tax=Eruca vesicaria subsp. sativa TaxID=29727 RepID=A0ABC8L211_ERUVS|nr:unnamed protein product [Eruca vesicaria subsp. sativa]
MLKEIVIKEGLNLLSIPTWQMGDTMLKETAKEKKIFVNAKFEDAKKLAHRRDALYVRIFAIKKLLKKLKLRESVDEKFKNILKSLSHFLVDSFEPCK